jgi:hypothetical protein
MTRSSRSHQGKRSTQGPTRKGRIPNLVVGLAVGVVLIGAVLMVSQFTGGTKPIDLKGPAGTEGGVASRQKPADNVWLERAYLVDDLFHRVYTPGWEGAYGALGDAYLYAATGDTTLLRFHFVEHPLTRLMNGNWLDDRAWACLAELTWWELTGKTNMQLVADAAQRYDEARAAGMLSHHEGYWTWYNYPPGARVNEPVFTNSNMNQMANVGCRLYMATGQKRYLDDALLIWNGDAVAPGVEKRLYRGGGKWEGREGRAAFGKELPWEGTGYCSIGSSLYRATGTARYREISAATARRILDPATGWVDPLDFYQLRMDGNGAFVHFLVDAYLVAPEELQDLPDKVSRMLEHVWTNHHGRARVMLHRETDHGIRNGWNPLGGEDGYGVDEVGTVHAQGEAVRAFCMVAYMKQVQSPAAR